MRPEYVHWTTMSTPQPAPHSQAREQAVRRTPAWACGAKAAVLSVLFALCASATLHSVPDRSWAEACRGAGEQTDSAVALALSDEQVVVTVSIDIESL